MLEVHCKIRHGTREPCLQNLERIDSKKKLLTKKVIRYETCRTVRFSSVGDDDDACGSTKSSQTTQPILPRWVDSVRKAYNEDAEELIACAIHCTTVQFLNFGKELWRDPFN